MAAVTVSQIVKEALSEIKDRHLMLTPENYTEVYNEISKKYGFTTEESKKIEKYISRLGDDYKAQAISLHIKTVDEFVAFMTARLSHGAKNGTAQVVDDKKLKSNHLRHISSRFFSSYLLASSCMPCSARAFASLL